jgi:hypothetical protein
VQEMNDLNWLQGFRDLRCLYKENCLADKLTSLFSENSPYDKVIYSVTYSNETPGTGHTLQLVGFLRRCGCGLRSSAI